MGIVEPGVVPVGRRQPERHLVGRFHLLAVQLGGGDAVAHQELDGRVVAERLLDRGRDERPVGLQPGEHLGLVGQGPQQVGDEVTGRLVPADEEEHQLGAGLDVGEAAAVDLGLQQPGDEVVPRLGPAGGDEVVDVGRELGVGAGEALTPLGAVLGRVRALHDLVGPAGPQAEVRLRGAEEVGDHAAGDGRDVVGDQVDRPAGGEQVVEQRVAEVDAERLDPTDAVLGDGRVDDAAHVAVAGLGDLADELLFVGYHHAGLAEAGLEVVDVLVASMTSS